MSYCTVRLNNSVRQILVEDAVEGHLTKEDILNLPLKNYFVVVDAYHGTDPFDLDTPETSFTLSLKSLTKTSY